jgi:hypothetical protein
MVEVGDSAGDAEHAVVSSSRKIRMEICMEDNRLPLPLPGREGSTIELVPAREQAGSLVHRYGFLAVWLFLLVSMYLIWKVARQLEKVASLDTQQERSIIEIDARLKGQAGKLDQTGHVLLQALEEAQERNARMERHLAQIEHARRALEKASTRILQDEQILGARLDQLYTRVRVPPVAAPAGQLSLPPGMVALPDDKYGEVWVVFREGKEHQMRPVARWSGGTLVRDLADGKQYLLTPEGQLRDLK